MNILSFSHRYNLREHYGEGEAAAKNPIDSNLNHVQLGDFFFLTEKLTVRRLRQQRGGRRLRRRRGNREKNYVCLRYSQIAVLKFQRFRRARYSRFFVTSFAHKQNVLLPIAAIGCKKYSFCLSSPILDWLNPMNWKIYF